MKTEIKRFTDFIQSKGFSLEEMGFNAGASTTEIAEIEQVTSQEIPSDLKELLSVINGQRTERLHFLLDQVVLLSCEDIIAQWQVHQEFNDDYPEYDLPESYDEYQDNDRIRGSLYAETRIPFAMQEGQGFIAIDNDPAPNGTKGQVIYLINECDFVVLATSIKTFFKQYNDAIAANILTFEKEKSDYANEYTLLYNKQTVDGYNLREAFSKISL
jgi:cell wall assembly regulator SMI1